MGRRRITTAPKPEILPIPPEVRKVVIDAIFGEKPGKQLAEELEKSQKEKQREIAQATVWGSANAAKTRNLRGDFDYIVENNVFVWEVEDMRKTYERLEGALRVGENRSEPGVLAFALDEAETNHRLAHRLFVTASLERWRWELENEVIFSAMKAEANRTLQKEKDEGRRNKQITDGDVRSMCASLFGDEWISQETKRKKVELAEESMKNLVDVWASRCRSLSTMLGRHR